LHEVKIVSQLRDVLHVSTAATNNTIFTLFHAVLSNPQIHNMQCTRTFQINSIY